MTGRHARVVYDLDEPAAEPGVEPADLGMCAWFALCPNPASTTQAHPILGDAPICASCVAWYGSLS